MSGNRGGRGGGGGDSSMSSSLKQTANTMVNQAEQKIKDKFEELTPILTKSQLRNLDQHKYAASGVTLLDPLLQPFWNWLVLQMPLYLAPNLITLVGLVINVLTSTILMIQSPNADQHLPAWSLILCSIGLIAYQSLDAIDGKQARRTNSSSPLGELFDHGCDAISLVFVTLAFGATLRLGTDPWLMFALMALSLTTFYTAHWQTYVSGALKFGKVDVTEGQAVVYTIFALTGLVGDALWSWRVPVLGVELRYAPVLIGIAGAFVSIFNNVHMISQGGKGKNGSSVADTSIVFPIFPLLLFLFMSFSIANKSAVVYLDNVCLYWLAFGFVWAKMTIKLIVAHMTKGEINLIDSCLIGPVLLLLNQYFGYIVSEFFVLFLCFGYSTFNLLEYCSKVCFQICTHMNIYLFKIRPPGSVAVDSSASSSSSSQQSQPVNPTSHVITRRQYQQQQQQHQH